eukprot:SM000056S17916  [mRNA]  locus=s56:170555:174361:+ [translate_table: standard]
MAASAEAQAAVGGAAVLTAHGLNPVCFSSATPPAALLRLAKGSSLPLAPGDQFYLAPGSCLVSVIAPPARSPSKSGEAIKCAPEPVAVNILLPLDADLRPLEPLTSPATASIKASCGLRDHRDKVQFDQACNSDDQPPGAAGSSLPDVPGWPPNCPAAGAWRAGPASGMEDVLATTTGYGLHRSSVVRLINRAGAAYVGSFSKDITHLICWTFSGAKYERARALGMHTVNHKWLEDSLSVGCRVAEPPYATHSTGGQADMGSAPLYSGSEVSRPRWLDIAGSPLSPCPAATRTPLPHAIRGNLKPADRDCAVTATQVERPRASAGGAHAPAAADGTGGGDGHGAVSQQGRVVTVLTDDGLTQEALPVSTVAGPAASAARSAAPAKASRTAKKRMKLEAYLSRLEDVDGHGQAAAASLPALGPPYLLSGRRGRQRRIRLRRAASGKATGASRAARQEDALRVFDMATFPSPDGRGRPALEQAVATSSGAPRAGGSDVCAGAVLTATRSVELPGSATEAHVPAADADQSSVQSPPSGGGCACVICRESKVAGNEGRLPCGHSFCFRCISTWAHTVERPGKLPECPLCKAPFELVTVREQGGDARAWQVPVRQKAATTPRPASSSESVCMTCGGGESVDQLVVCTSCRSGIHIFCLEASLPENAAHREPWLCAGCEAERRRTEEADQWQRIFPNMPGASGDGSSSIGQTTAAEHSRSPPPFKLDAQKLMIVTILQVNVICQLQLSTQAIYTPRPDRGIDAAFARILMPAVHTSPQELTSSTHGYSRPLFIDRLGLN